MQSDDSYRRLLVLLFVFNDRPLLSAARGTTAALSQLENMSAQLETVVVLK
jgi:hypothetical protein